MSISDESIWSPTMNGIPDGQARFSPEAIAEGIDLEAAIQAKHTVLMRREKEDGR